VSTHTRTPVSEDGRSWEAMTKTTETAIDTVLTILCDRSPREQKEIRRELCERLGVCEGTAAAYTSASLLFMREEGWIRCVSPAAGPRSAIWELA
jgi:hypothetical protein